MEDWSIEAGKLLSREEFGYMLAASQGISYTEMMAMPKVEGEEVLDLLDYDSYFRLGKIRFPETRIGILQVLVGDNLIKKQGDRYDILNLGALLFARNMGQLRRLQRKTVRIITYKNGSRLNALREYEWTQGYASGFEGLITYIAGQLPTEEFIESALRRTEGLYPEVAIRELLANALIHQDFTINGRNIMVEIFTNRIEITNSGLPNITVDRFIDISPQPRNGDLARLMRRMNICEDRGTGVDRAIDALEERGLPAPKFSVGDNYTQVTLYNTLNIAQMPDRDKAQNCYLHVCLAFLKGEKATISSVAQRFRTDEKQAQKIVEMGIAQELIAPSTIDLDCFTPYWA